MQAGSFDGWMQDPYDSEYKKGVQKNLSDNSEYDAQFPDHPLSVLHRFVKTITGFAADKAASGEGDDDSKALEKILDAAGVDMKAFEETINEIMPGLAMYVRDVNLNEACAAAYKQPHLFLMERGFTDASVRLEYLTPESQTDRGHCCRHGTDEFHSVSWSCTLRSQWCSLCLYPPDFLHGIPTGGNTTDLPSGCGSLSWPAGSTGTFFQGQHFKPDTYRRRRDRHSYGIHVQ